MTPEEREKDNQSNLIKYMEEIENLNRIIDMQNKEIKSLKSLIDQRHGGPSGDKKVSEKITGQKSIVPTIGGVSIDLIKQISAIELAKMYVSSTGGSVSPDILRLMRGGGKESLSYRKKLLKKIYPDYKFKSNEMEVDTNFDSLTLKKEKNTYTQSPHQLTGGFETVSKAGRVKHTAKRPIADSKPSPDTNAKKKKVDESNNASILDEVSKDMMSHFNEGLAVVESTSAKKDVLSASKPDSEHADKDDLVDYDDE